MGWITEECDKPFCGEVLGAVAHSKSCICIYSQRPASPTHFQEQSTCGQLTCAVAAGALKHAGHCAHCSLEVQVQCYPSVSSPKSKWVVPGIVPLTLHSSHFNPRFLISVAIIITLKQDMHFLLYIDRSDTYLDASFICTFLRTRVIFCSPSLLIHTPPGDLPSPEGTKQTRGTVLKNLIYFVFILRKQEKPTSKTGRCGSDY